MRKSPKFSLQVQERAVRKVFDAKDQYPSQVVAESNVSLMGLTVRSSTDGEWLQTLAEPSSELVLKMTVTVRLLLLSPE